MFEIIDTPFKGAAVGVAVLALWILLLSQSDFVLRIFDQNPNRAHRDARRARFKNYALTLLGISISNFDDQETNIGKVCKYRQLPLPFKFPNVKDTSNDVKLW